MVNIYLDNINISGQAQLPPVAAFTGDTDGCTGKTLQFYDYTKVLGRKIKDYPNYHLTFSAADGNDSDVQKAIAQGYNVAVVFGIKKTLPMPADYLSMPVFNGDESDLRFLDPSNVVVGLYAKGKAKKDNTGFVKFIQLVSA